MNDWMNNPAMKNIDPIKLELIKTSLPPKLPENPEKSWLLL